MWLAMRFDSQRCNGGAGSSNGGEGEQKLNVKKNKKSNKKNENENIKKAEQGGIGRGLPGGRMPYVVVRFSSAIALNVFISWEEKKPKPKKTFFAFLEKLRAKSMFNQFIKLVNKVS